MSSALQFALTSVQRNDHLALAILTAIGYDYVLLFSQEVGYIWCKPWSLVSALFIVVHYVGFYSIAFYSLGKIFYVISEWSLLLFLGAIDVIILLRAWAMYNRSKLVLYALVTSVTLDGLLNAFPVAINYAPRNLSVAAIHILDFSVCEGRGPLHVLQTLGPIASILHTAFICILAIAKYTRQTVQMYHVTKQWQPNRYMSLLVKDGILYFLAIFMLSVVNVTTDEGTSPSGRLAMSLVFVFLYAIGPRFIISIRALYVRDIRGERVDTGFGLSLPGPTGRDASDTAIEFAEVGRSEDERETEIIEMTPVARANISVRYF